MTDIQKILMYSKLHPLVAYQWLLKTFGKESLFWEPEALWITITKTVKVSLPRDNKDCIQAVRAVANPKTKINWFTFEKIVSGLNNKVVLFDTVQPLSVPELIFGLNTIPDIHSIKYSTEVQRYIAATCMNNNVYKLPGGSEADKYLKEAIDIFDITVNNLTTSISAMEETKEYLKNKDEDYRVQARIFNI